jgi:hypothetical protein
VVEVDAGATTVAVDEAGAVEAAVVVLSALLVAGGAAVVGDAVLCSDWIELSWEVAEFTTEEIEDSTEDKLL